MLQMNMRNQSHLEEVQKLHHQNNLQDNWDQANLHAQDYQMLIFWSQSYKVKVKPWQKGKDSCITAGGRIHGDKEDDRNGSWKTAHLREGG